MAISYIFYDGVVKRVESDEYAEITNEGGAAVNLAGWRLNAGAPGQDFRFPEFVLGPGQLWRVYTNEYHPESCGFSFGSGQPMWSGPGRDGLCAQRRVSCSTRAFLSAPTACGAWFGGGWWDRSPGSTLAWWWATGYWVRPMPAIVFQTYADLHGYLWSFPRPDHASVGVGSRLGAVPPRDLWQRLDRFLDEVCPGARKGDRFAALLPMARDATLWDTPCAGPGWALLGDAAGHVHPITGEGIAYALWSAESLSEAFRQGDPQVYEDLWRESYGQGLRAAGAMLSRAGLGNGAFEVVFQLAMAMALSAADQVH